MYRSNRAGGPDAERKRGGTGANKMKIAIYNNGIPFDGTTPLKQPLGGSESSIVYMARNLARCGHDVTVYVNLPGGPSRSDSDRSSQDEAAYRHYHEFFSDYISASWDVLISFRSF